MFLSFFVFWGFFGLSLQPVELPQLGIEPVPPEVEAWSLNHWTTKKAPCVISFKASLWNKSFFFLTFIQYWNNLYICHQLLCYVPAMLNCPVLLRLALKEVHSSALFSSFCILDSFPHTILTTFTMVAKV